MIRLIALVAFLGALTAPAAAQEAEDSPLKFVAMTTTVGTFYIEVYPDEAPVTVESFLRYVEDDFYDGTIFHRVIPGFVIQGGGFTADFDKKATREPITNEADNGLRNSRGTLSMARTSAVNSATTQFFVNLVDNPALDHTGTMSSRSWGYAVFGKVVRGMEVVDDIAALPTGPAGPFRSDVPQETVIIQEAVVLDALPPREPVQTPESTTGDGG